MILLFGRRCRELGCLHQETLIKKLWRLLRKPKTKPSPLTMMSLEDLLGSIPHEPSNTVSEGLDALGLPPVDDDNQLAGLYQPMGPRLYRLLVAYGYADFKLWYNRHYGGKIACLNDEPIVTGNPDDEDYTERLHGFRQEIINELCTRVRPDRVMIRVVHDLDWARGAGFQPTEAYPADGYGISWIKPADG